MWVVQDLEEVFPSRTFVNFLLPASVKCWYLCPGKKGGFFNRTSGKCKMHLKKTLNAVYATGISRSLKI